MAAIDRTPWPAPQARGPLSATVELPGSKSLTNRAVVLAALSTTPTRITAPLLARDTVLMADALRSLGVDIAPDGADWLVHPGVVRAGAVDCGLAGTVMRFLPPVAALGRGDSVFDGDPHARTRPMRTLLDGLRQAGVNVDDGGTGLLPFTVRGQGTVPGGVLELDASASSQFVSGLLLSGARFDKGVEIHHVGGALPSQPHIDMTVSMLREAGVAVDDTQPNRWVVAPGPIDLPDTVIEPDLSNAAPFLAAALVAGGSVTVPRWPSHTTQAGDALRDLLIQMGGSVSLTPSGLTVSGAGSVGPLVADLHDVGELTPVLAALAALADGASRLTGVAHIRGHETDRLSALAAELESFGADVDELPDGLVIRPAQLSGGIWHAYADHRMAQAGAVLGLRVPGVEVDDIASTTKTMADFPALWTSLLEQPLAE
jgi:3-phosphoshikimate 1-carboxyvinyltransferase